MINLAKDPKGYYVALGVDENATADDIKSAFRAKAKRLHPDRNPSPIAAKQFHRVREAYETLTDPLRRAAYDRGWRTYTGGAAAGERARTAERDSTPPPHEAPREPHREQPREPHRDTQRDAQRDTQRDAQRDPPGAKAKSEPPHTTGSRAAAEAPAVCKCGKVTAQPRYIVFDMVWGRLRKVQRRGVAGVFCRTCADRTAIRASWVTWLAGWWAWPNGPRETVKAIVSNMRGGRRPPERNARLLMRQARAFRARGDMDLARACAEQALAFAPTPELRRDIDSLLLSLSAYSARTIKDRWREPGFAVMAQALPPAVLAGVAAMGLTLSADRSLIDTLSGWFEPAPRAERAPPAAAANTAPHAAPDSGRVYAVRHDGLALRTGPSGDYRTLQLLAKDTLVLATEADPGGLWVRVMLSDRTTGFVPLTGLTPEIAVDAIDALAGFGKDERPPEQTPGPNGD